MKTPTAADGPHPDAGYLNGHAHHEDLTRFEQAVSRPGIRKLLLGAADRQPFTDRSEVHLDFPDAPAPEPPPEDGLSDLPQVRPAAPIVVSSSK